MTLKEEKILQEIVLQLVWDPKLKSSWVMQQGNDPHTQARPHRFKISQIKVLESWLESGWDAVALEKNSNVSELNYFYDMKLYVLK